jgi:ComF family protein
MRSLWKGLLHLLFPATCPVCTTPLPPEGNLFCASCRAGLTEDPLDTCPYCAATVGPFANVAEGCSLCREIRFPFERVIRLGGYEGLRREVVLRMKQRSGETLAEMTGTLWAAQARVQLSNLDVGVVIPVPLHWLRRWQRGFNQSEALAYGLAKGLGLPCRPRWLRRIRNTPPQTQQSAAGRRANVRGAFRARGTALVGRNVLLVDDVMTTGSTVSEAAAGLLKGGCRRVVVAVLARSQL